jgi:hypothetical protein
VLGKPFSLSSFPKYPVPQISFACRSILVASLLMKFAMERKVICGTGY